MTPVTRRQLLAGITAAGAAGTLSGVGTAALLVDRETLAASVESGRVELRVDTGDGPTDAVGGPVELPFPALDAGDAGSVALSFVVPDEPGVNPAYLWLRAGCGSASGLGDQLAVTLSRTDGAAETLYDGDLAGLIDALSAGIPLDPSGAAAVPGGQDCLAPGTTVALELAYALSTGYVGSTSTSLLIEGAAIQCRRVDPTTPPAAFAIPLGVADCTAAADCACPTLVGKYDLPGSGSLIPGLYQFTDGSDDYRLVVSDVETKDGGEAVAARFRVVLAADPTVTVPLDRVLLKAATDVFVYEGDAALGVIGTDGHGISNVTVGVCLPAVDGDCPDDFVSEPNDKPGKSKEKPGESNDKPGKSNGGSE
ncbi:hypothetical protein [Halolamina sp. C58]|uniref:hypothetical protein n=1 Tax=Halolamina sp. C58 TaxID=3421640 RepID=UPI003EBA352E